MRVRDKVQASAGSPPGDKFSSPTLVIPRAG
jgi:hypothetical protein